MKSILSGLTCVLILAGCTSTPPQTPRTVTSTPDPNTPRPDAPFPDRAYKAELSLPKPVTTMKAGQKQTIAVKVKNASDVLWIAYGTNPGVKYRVSVGDIWLDSKGQLVTMDDGRIGLPANLAPGSDVEVPLIVTAPAKVGDYVLQLDVVHEGVAWFKDKGSPAFKVNVKVE